MSDIGGQDAHHGGNPESVDMVMAGSSDGESRDAGNLTSPSGVGSQKSKDAANRRCDMEDDSFARSSRHRSGNRNDHDDGRFELQDSRESYLNDTNHDSIQITREAASKSKNIIYVTNITPIATLEQMRILFSFVGDIVSIVMYQFEPTQDTNFKVCFIEYSQHSSVLVAQHLTNTVFIDRAIFVLPFNHSKIPPDKETAIKQGYDNTEYVTNFNDGVLTQVASGPGGAQIITTSDARLAASSLQTYPQLPINTDPTRVEEIRRTLYIGNLDSSLPPEQVLKFFNDMGEVKYIRIAGDETQPTRFAFVEFTNQASVANALLHHGFVLGSRSLKINHSNNPIVKPQPKLEIDDSSKRARDCRSAKDSKHHSSSSRNDGRRDRTRSYYDRRSPRDYRSSRRSRSRDRELSSRSRRSRSRDHRRSRSREDIHRRRSRSRESRKRRSRSRSDDGSRQKSRRR